MNEYEMLMMKGIFYITNMLIMFYKNMERGILPEIIMQGAIKNNEEVAKYLNEYLDKKELDEQA